MTDFRINGENVPTWDRFSIAIGLRADRDVQLTIVRDGREEQVGVRRRHRAALRWVTSRLPDVHPHVASVVIGGPAERACLKPGDVFLAVNNQRVVFSGDVVDLVSASPKASSTFASAGTLRSRR